jgi:hypothetical protein
MGHLLTKFNKSSTQDIRVGNRPTDSSQPSTGSGPQQRAAAAALHTGGAAAVSVVAAGITSWRSHIVVLHLQ